MKTTDFAIHKVYSIIKSSEMEQEVFKLTKQTKKNLSEYIVINALPISDGVLQKCRVNVNYHVKDLLSGVPDMKKLEDGTANLMTLLEDVPATGIIIDFESQEYHSENELGEHYSNIRLSVKIINT